MAERVRPAGATRRHSRNIQRLDRRGFHGFVVSFTRRGEHHGRFFSDRKYGGRRCAEAAAQAWRDLQLLELYPPIRIRRFYPRNKTGEMGVTLERYRSGAHWYQRYRVSCPDGQGGIARGSFSVRKYGRERAFAMAVEVREKGVAQLERYVRGQLAAEVVKRRARRGLARGRP